MEESNEIGGQMMPNQPAFEPSEAAEPVHLHIGPPKGLPSINLRELFDYRELLFFLVWRDIKVRYKQTVLGATWAIIQPLMTMVVFSLFFGKLAGLPSEGVPYPIFSYAALVRWAFFGKGNSCSQHNLHGLNQRLLTLGSDPCLIGHMGLRQDRYAFYAATGRQMRLVSRCANIRTAHHLDGFDWLSNV